MTPQELLRLLLKTPELSIVGSPEERAAFIALRIDGLTVRDAGQAIGISKSHVPNLADLFQVKLRRKVIELRYQRESTLSVEFRELQEELYNLMPPEHEDHVRIGNYEDGMSREDRAEATGRPYPKFDGE